MPFNMGFQAPGAGGQPMGGFPGIYMQATFPNTQGWMSFNPPLQSGPGTYPPPQGGPGTYPPPNQPYPLGKSVSLI